MLAQREYAHIFSLALPMPLPLLCQSVLRFCGDGDRVLRRMALLEGKCVIYSYRFDDRLPAKRHDMDLHDMGPQERRANAARRFEFNMEEQNRNELPRRKSNLMA